MGEVMLTVQQAQAALDYNPDTGILARRSSNPRWNGKPAGTNHSNGYVAIYIGGEYHLAHRLAWLLHYGRWPAGQIDHINGDRRDNRIANLRDFDRSTNLQNMRGATKRSSTGLIGATRHYTGKFRAVIHVDGRQKNLGVFGTPEEAHEAYLAAKRVYHQGCTI
jgi:hypothetical protein